MKSDCECGRESCEKWENDVWKRLRGSSLLYVKKEWLVCKFFFS